MKTELTKNFLRLQCSSLLLVLTLLPEFDLFAMMTGIDLNFPVIICKLAGVAGVAISLLKIYQERQEARAALPMPLFILNGGGALLTLLSLIPSLPGWLSYAGLIMLFIALFLAKNALLVQWNTTATGGAYLVLMAMLLHVFTFVNDTMATTTAALIGLILYIVALGRLKSEIDATGQSAISKLKIAIIVSIIASIFNYIPLMGWLSTVLAIIAFLFEFMGYGKLKESVSVGDEGRSGAGMLRNSMIVLMVSALVGFLSDTAAGFIALIALIMVFSGWTQILFGLEEQKEIA